MVWPGKIYHGGNFQKHALILFAHTNCEYASTSPQIVAKTAIIVSTCFRPGRKPMPHVPEVCDNLQCGAAPHRKSPCRQRGQQI